MARAKSPRRLTLADTLACISLASMLTAATSARTQAQEGRSVPAASGEHFGDFLVRVTNAPDSSSRSALIREFVGTIKARGRALIEDTTVIFLYQGKAKRVGVPSDLNGWNASADTMTRLEGTDLFFLPATIHRAARFEYKFVVDSTWILDPYNRQQAMGGYGPNSEIWMPGYEPPEEIIARPGIPRGSLDTLAMRSRVLGRTHPVFVSLPPDYKQTRRKYPTLYVTDGGEYLSLALMNNVIDNLIADGRIEPIIAVFVDPRTDVRDSETSMRMHDYTMSDTFVTFLSDELLPRIRRTYRVLPDPQQTGIMGASLGGLIATYAAYRRPDLFGLCAAQSPSYWWNDEAMITLVADGPRKPVRFSIDTGTIRDAQVHAHRMAEVLRKKGYELSYAEHPEGHNWVNWRARVDDILTYFWGKK